VRLIAIFFGSKLTASQFPHVLIDDFLDTQFASEVLCSWPSYEDAAKMAREFRSINERKKVQVTDSARFPRPLRQLNEALASPEFIEAVSTIFGIRDLLPDPELDGGGLHQTGPRGRLDVHVDFNYIGRQKTAPQAEHTDLFQRRMVAGMGRST
jgi:hypothetical protein